MRCKKKKYINKFLINVLPSLSICVKNFRYIFLRIFICISLDGRVIAFYIKIN